MPIDLRTKGKGCIKNKLDVRDFRLEVALGAVVLPLEFSVRDKIGKIKDQGGSLSCVGQASSYYAEVLNQIETGEKIQLSARDVYSLIFDQNTGGANLRDGAKKITNSGVILEKDAPSYENGTAPSEAFMRQRSDISPEEQETGMTYLAKSYFTFSNKKWETYKQAIFRGNGCITGAMGNNYCWQNAILEVPGKGQEDWGHCIFLIGWKIIEGKEYLEFCNSWGENWGDGGFGYMPKEYVEAGLTFNPITLADLPNKTYPVIQSEVFKISEQFQILFNLIKEYIRQRVGSFFGGIFKGSFNNWFDKGRKNN